MMSAASSSSQPRNALKLANAKKARQNEVKRALKNRTITLAEAFENEAVSGLQVRKLMECVPYLTSKRVSYILLWARVGYAREVGSIQAGEYWRIMSLLRSRHPGIKVAP